MSKTKSVLRYYGMLWLTAAVPYVWAGGNEGYYQQPDIHGDRLVFCAERDLWTVPSTGGLATRLTHDDGNEYFPQFSPDGTQIAFSAAYQGNVDVYIIPSTGGEPQRLTWHGSPDEVIGWVPDGKQVIFRSLRNDPMGTWRLYTVDLQGGDAQEMPLAWAARIDVDAESGPGRSIAGLVTPETGSGIAAAWPRTSGPVIRRRPISGN